MIKSIYTDGSCLGNPGPGGWAIVIYFADGSLYEDGGYDPDTTNNKMELQAAIASLQFIKEHQKQQSITIYTDSEYVKKGITQWLQGWKKNNWQNSKKEPVANQELWQILDQLNSNLIQWQYVKAHAGNEGNERADQIARSFASGKPPILTQKIHTMTQPINTTPTNTKNPVYIPLHHKYRPQTFADLVGQKAITTTLINALLSERIAPAYLFTGSRGTGKTSSARILAKSLNCLNSKKPTDNPCGKCETCQSITKGNSLDIIEIDAASNTGVDNIRELIERAQFSPVQCRYKVYIIDEVHMLSTAAFNALLKTLEEPPERVIFILATTDPQRVLPTIISRCQRFDFRRIPLEEMVKHLTYIAKEENININQPAITLVAQFAQGGLRDAESLLDQLSLLTGNITPDQVWDLVGAVPERDLLDLLESLSENNGEKVLSLCRKLMDRGREPLIVLQNLAGFYRDLLIAKTAPQRQDLIALTEPTWKQLCQVAKKMEINVILQGQKHLKESEFQIKNTTQPRLWLEITLLGLLPSALTTVIIQQETPVNTTSQKSPVTSQEKVNPSVSISEKREEKTSNIKVENVAQTPVNSHTNEEDLEEIWTKVLNNLKKSSQSMINQFSKLLSISNHQVIIVIKNKVFSTSIIEKKAEIENAFTQVLNRKIMVVWKHDSDLTQEAKTSKRLTTEKKDEENLIKPVISEEDEVTKAAQQIADFFKGEIVKITDIAPDNIPDEEIDF